MMQLFQTEWCPASQRLRQRLTELGVDYVVRQVPVDKQARTALVAATGGNSIPVLVLGDGTILTDEVPIRTWLDEHVAEPTAAVAHREKAARVRRRELQEAAAALIQPEIPPDASLPMRLSSTHRGDELLAGAASAGVVGGLVVPDAPDAPDDAAPGAAEDADCVLAGGAACSGAGVASAARGVARASWLA